LTAKGLEKKLKVCGVFVSGVFKKLLVLNLIEPLVDSLTGMPNVIPLGFGLLNDSGNICDVNDE
jgi:hypothetical protein